MIRDDVLPVNLLGDGVVRRGEEDGPSTGPFRNGLATAMTTWLLVLYESTMCQFWSVLTPPGCGTSTEGAFPDASLSSPRCLCRSSALTSRAIASFVRAYKALAPRSWLISAGFWNSIVNVLTRCSSDDYRQRRLLGVARGFGSRSMVW